MSSFGYNVLGFGGGGSRRVGVIQIGTGETSIQYNGYNTAITLADPQEGDLVMATTGCLISNSNTLLSGYTSIAAHTSPLQWGNHPLFYVQGRICYRILTASDTEVPSGITDGGGTFMQYRFAKKISSVSLQGLASVQGGVTGNYSAITTANKFIIRWVSGTAYAPSTNTLSSGSPQYATTGNNYGNMRITETRLGGAYANSGPPQFGGRSYYVTLICNL